MYEGEEFPECEDILLIPKDTTIGEPEFDKSDSDNSGNGWQTVKITKEVATNLPLMTTIQDKNSEIEGINFKKVNPQERIPSSSSSASSQESKTKSDSSKSGKDRKRRLSHANAMNSSESESDIDEQNSKRNWT